MVRLFIRGGALLAIMVTASAAVAQPAFAHASLTGCNIHNNQVIKTGTVPAKLKCHFAQDLNPDHSWMAVFEGVADHGLVTEHSKSVISFSNPRVMTLKLPRLAPLKYYMIWYTHSEQDGHFAAGILYFKVTK